MPGCATGGPGRRRPPRLQLSARDALWAEARTREDFERDAEPILARTTETMMTVVERAG